jgi:cellulose synthase/poly-beta-1,6-N-acetylglucosamine synthase-like glycosyltransferase
VLFAGAPPPGRTGKLHAMSLGEQVAQGELIAFSDSDTRVDPALIRRLVEQLLATPEAGDVFAPALADSPVSTAGDVGYALMLNAWYGAAAVAAAGPRRELPFIMGQLMVFRRDALAAIGGVQSADGQLVDDMYLGRRMVETGRHNLISEAPLRIVTGGMSWREFMHLQRRWMLFSRSGLPARFKRAPWLRGLTVWAAIIAAALGAFAAWPDVVIAALALTVGIGLSDRALHHAMGGGRIPLRDAWVSLAVVLLGPISLASVWLDPHVSWRGRRYTLDSSATLDEQVG